MRTVLSGIFIGFDIGAINIAVNPSVGEGGEGHPYMDLWITTIQVHPQRSGSVIPSFRHPRARYSGRWRLVSASALILELL